MKIDGRTLDHGTLEHLRLTACRRVDEGELPSAVIESMGLCRTTIYRWLRAKRQRGEEGLKSRKALGPRRLLGKRKQRILRRWILSRDPRAFGFVEALWSRRIIQALVKMKFHIAMSITAVGELLASLRITPQKPLRRAYERDPQTVKDWQENEYPRIRARAKRRNALIMFLDEAGIQSDAPLGMTWGERGKTPVVQTSGQRQKINAISAVSPTGEFRFAVYSTRFNADLFITILKKFTRNLRRPCYFVVDGHPAHRANRVRDYVVSTKGKIELYFLPPYAPDLNPDEFVWNQIKHHGMSKVPLVKNQSLKKRVVSDLVAIQRNPQLVRAFFKAKSVAYVSA